MASRPLVRHRTTPVSLLTDISLYNEDRPGGSTSPSDQYQRLQEAIDAAAALGEQNGAALTTFTIDGPWWLKGGSYLKLPRRNFLLRGTGGRTRRTTIKYLPGTGAGGQTLLSTASTTGNTLDPDYLSGRSYWNLAVAAYRGATQIALQSVASSGGPARNLAPGYYVLLDDRFVQNESGGNLQGYAQGIARELLKVTAVNRAVVTIEAMPESFWGGVRHPSFQHVGGVGRDYDPAALWWSVTPWGQTSSDVLTANTNPRLVWVGDIASQNVGVEGIYFNGHDDANPTARYLAAPLYLCSVDGLTVRDVVVDWCINESVTTVGSRNVVYEDVHSIHTGATPGNPSGSYGAVMYGCRFFKVIRGYGEYSRHGTAMVHGGTSDGIVTKGFCDKFTKDSGALSTRGHESERVVMVENSPEVGFGEAGANGNWLGRLIQPYGEGTTSGLYIGGVKDGIFVNCVGSRVQLFSRVRGTNTYQIPPETHPDGVLIRNSKFSYGAFNDCVFCLKFYPTDVDGTENAHVAHGVVSEDCVYTMTYPIDGGFNMVVGGAPNEADIRGMVFRRTVFEVYASASPYVAGCFFTVPADRTVSAGVPSKVEITLEDVTFRAHRAGNTGSARRNPNCVFRLPDASVCTDVTIYLNGTIRVEGWTGGGTSYGAPANYQDIPLLSGVPDGVRVKVVYGPTFSLVYASSQAA